MDLRYSILEVLEERGLAAADVALDCKVGGARFADLSEHVWRCLAHVYQYIFIKHSYINEPIVLGQIVPPPHIPNKKKITNKAITVMRL